MLQILVALQAAFVNATDRIREEKGAAVVEYGIVLAFVVIVLGAILYALQDPISTWFGKISTSITTLKPT